MGCRHRQTTNIGLCVYIYIYIYISAFTYTYTHVKNKKTKKKVVPKEKQQGAHKCSWIATSALSFQQEIAVFGQSFRVVELCFWICKEQLSKCACALSQYSVLGGL